VYPFSFGLGSTLINDGRYPFPWVHVDDVAGRNLLLRVNTCVQMLSISKNMWVCAGIIQHAIERPTIAGVLNAVAPATDTYADFVQAFAKALRHYGPIGRICVSRRA
jgi:NAD dependent epimerase/dehydratase family enzyme